MKPTEIEMNKTSEQIKTELASAWKRAIEKTKNNDDGVVYRVFLDHNFDFVVLYTRTNEATYCVVSPDDYCVNVEADVDDVLEIAFHEIMDGLEQE